LFDAAAALTGLVHYADFEGHAAMWLEAASSDFSQPGIALPLSRNAEHCWLSDWQPLLTLLQDKTLSLGARSACFHASLAITLVEQAKHIRDERGSFVVGLSGGVFQNKRLTELTMSLLQQAGFNVYVSERISGNDAGLSFGQIIEIAMSSIGK
jgi:hydrogenase maturation protein HypF